MDAPYPWRRARLYEAVTIILALTLVVSIALVQHRASDLAFRQYALTTTDVELSALIAHPDAFRGQRIHVTGVAGDTFVNDIGNVFRLSTSASLSSDTQSVLVFSRAYVPTSQRMDVWGVYEGPEATTGSAPRLSLATIRAEYTRAAR